MKIFDAHFHPEEYGNKNAVSAAIEIAGGLCCSSSEKDWQKTLEITRNDKTIIPCIGIHPWNVAEIPPEKWANMRRLVMETGSFIGEIGLDALRPDMEMQEKVFAEQLLMAKETGLPAVIHCVRAWRRLVETINKINPGRFMIHSFNGSPETMRQIIALGGFVSFGPGLANEKAKKSRTAFLSVPLDKFMLESEGEISQMAGLIQAAEATAKIKNMPIPAIINAANENYMEFVSLGL